MEMKQHPYWHGPDIIEQALAMNNVAAAATAFHRAVSSMPASIAEAEADYDSIPEDVRAYHALLRVECGEDFRHQDFYPFTGRDDFAFAAARKDHGALQILDSTCGSYNEEPEPCSADYLRIVQTLQDMVAANDITDIKDVRKVFSPIDRVRLRSVWRAMRDARILVVESQGQKVLFHRAAPEPASLGWKPILFRKGMPSATTVVLEWPEHLNGPGRADLTGLGELFDQWPMAGPGEDLLPKASRRVRKSETISVGNSTWLQDVTINKKADGSLFRTTTVINPNGSHGPKIELPEGILRSNPQGDCGISIDRKSVARIYTSDAEQVLALDLSVTPEVRDTMIGFEDKHLKTNAAIRSVHASLAAERLVVSVIHKVFVYSFEGDVIAAFHLDALTKSKSYGPVEVSSHDTDWAYFVQLAVDGQGVYVGAYSGVLLHLSLSGELLDSWVLPETLRFLRETAQGISGGCGSLFFHASRGSGEVHFLFVDPHRTSQLVGRNVILDTRTATGFFDLDSFVGRSVQLPQPRTAVYIAGGELIMETATTRYTF